MRRGVTAVRWRNLTKESVEQTTFQSIDAASPVPPHAPGVRLFLAGRRGLATGHLPGAGNYTGKPRGAAGVRKHVSPLSPRLLGRSPSPLKDGFRDPRNYVASDRVGWLFL
jgi:hypothetical protein